MRGSFGMKRLGTLLAMTSSLTTPPLIACVGGGNMARAMVEGAVRAGVIGGERWVIAEPDTAKHPAFTRLGAVCVARPSELAARMGEQTQVLLAVKPQSLGAVAAECAAPGEASLAAGRVVISILAGTPIARVIAALPGCRVVRAMPNTPAQVGQGCTAIALGPGVRPGDEDVAVRLFGAVGPVVERVDESLMDAFTAVAGSGPAYVFYLAEAMTKAAVELGFDPSVADRVVRQTIVGSAALLSAAPERSAEELRAAVTSKGGTTEAATRVLEGAGVRDALMRALAAARDRGRELGR